jgi:hypothetical protein
MNSEVCLFCNRLEKKYKPETGKYFICSQCVQLLLSADQAELMGAYKKAIEKGYPDKARAIKSFLIPEEKINGQRKPISKKRRRHIDRKGIDRTTGDKEKRIGRSKVPTETPIL